MHKRKTINFYVTLAVFIVTTLSGMLTLSTNLFLYILGVYDNPLTVKFMIPMTAFLVCIIVGTFLSAIVSRVLLKPINELIRAIQMVAKGDFTVRVQKIPYRGELSELMNNFNVMAEELGSTEIFRQNFINNFSHEFKTPIVSIRGFARRLQKSSLSDQQRKEYTDIIIEEAERLTNMSSNILLLTKFENQQIISDKKEFHLDEQLRRCVLLLEKQWNKKNISFNMNLSEVLYYSNEEMLSHVWLNLLSNAIKFSNHDSKINVKCFKDIQNIIVIIKDHGIGIDSNTINKIFDKFYQGDASHTIEGNGLGLSLVKRIIMLCKGEISVSSEVGKGTTFVIKLPMEL